MEPSFNFRVMTDLQSSMKKQGKWISQVIHFVDGQKRTFENIDSRCIKQGQFTKLTTKDGRFILVNDQNVLCIEVFKEHGNEK